MSGLATCPPAAAVDPITLPRGLRRIVLLDPGLFYEGGHHASLARMLRDTATRQGADAVICGAKRIDHPPAGLEITRHFRTSPYASLPAWGLMPALRACNDDVLEDACGLPEDLLADADIVLIPTITSRNALGFARWLARRPGAAPPAAVVLMFPPGWAGDETLRAAEQSVYREALGILAALPAGRVALFAETAPLAALFMRLGGPVVRPLPWPVALVRPETPRLPFDPLGTPPHVAHLGHTRLETGIGLLPDVIRTVTAADPAVRFSVQANFWNAPAVERCVRDIETLAPVARVIHGALTPGAYADVMREADIVLLPYDPRSYRDRGSGVFAEAAAGGRIVVIPAGTWMADQAAAWNLGAVTFDRFDATSVAVAVGRAVDDRATLLERAAASATAWREDRRPARFLARILEMMPATRPTGTSPAVRGTPRAEPGDDDFPVRVLPPGGLGIHTTCAANPRHGYPAFGDYDRFLRDGLEQLFEGVDLLVKAEWGNRPALLYNLAIDDGHGLLGGRRFGPALGAPNEDDHPWHTWIIFRRC